MHLKLEAQLLFWSKENQFVHFRLFIYLNTQYLYQSYILDFLCQLYPNILHLVPLQFIVLQEASSKMAQLLFVIVRITAKKTQNPRICWVTLF